MKSRTAGNRPSFLRSGQLAINERDRMMYYNDPDAGAPRSLFDQLAAFTADQNMFVNPAMEVDQANAGTAVTGLNAAAGWTYVLDGCAFFTTSAPSAGRFSAQRVTDAPPGYANSVRLWCTTAQPTLAYGDSFGLYFPIDPQVGARLKWGTAFAQPLTLSFWVKAFRPGLYSATIQNFVNTRTYSYMYNVVASGVWQYVSCVVPGDTYSSAWNPANDYITLWMVLAAGAGDALSPPSTWFLNWSTGGVGQTNGATSTSDYMNITGIAVHAGNVPMPAERAPLQMPTFDEALLRSMRYFETSYDIDTLPGTHPTTNGASIFFMANAASRQYAGYVVVPITPKALVPAIALFSPHTGVAGNVYDFANSIDVAPTVQNIGLDSFEWGATSNAVTTSPQLQAHWTADSRL